MVENADDAALHFSLDNVIRSSNIVDVMAPKKPRKDEQRVMSFKATRKDQAIIEAGREKHGANLSGIIRMALRRFAEAEGIEVKAS